jgi:undecaprenyl-diphosphatase
MLEQILEYERGAFLWLNGNHNTYWDSFMWLYTGQIVWIPVLLVFIILLFYKKGWKESLLIILSIVLIITLCDQISSNIFKPFFMRFRPTHHPDFMDYVHTVNDYRGGRYGFISGHATNAFGFATFIILLFHNRLFTISILVWSTLMVYTRIYLGVHFISDVIPGVILGILVGFGIFKLYVLFRQRLLKTIDIASLRSNPDNVNLTIMTEKYIESGQNLLLISLYATVLFIFIFSYVKH